MERQHYVVFMVVACYHKQAGSDGERDYLLPVKAPDGQMTYFTLEHAYEWIERTVERLDPPAGLMGRGACVRGRHDDRGGVRHGPEIVGRQTC